MRRSLTPEMFRPHPSRRTCAVPVEWHSGQRIRVLLRYSSSQIALEYGAIRIGSGFAADNPVPGLLQLRNSRTPREEIHAEYFELQDDRSCFHAAALVEGITQRTLQCASRAVLKCQDHRARPQHMTTVSLMLVGVRDRERTGRAQWLKRLRHRVWIKIEFAKNGAGGGNRTHGLGIMRPSLYH